MRIISAKNIMGDQLPIETVRTAPEVRSQFEAARKSESQFARGVQATIRWMLRRSASSPLGAK